MKFSKSLFVMFVSVVFIAVSCKAPSVSKNEAYEDGAIGITVKLHAAAGRAAFTQDDAASYKIEMSLNETVVQTKTGLPGQTVTLKVEAEGLYTVTVTAYDATEREIAKGSATADLKFGDGIVPLQIKIRGYKKEIEIVPEIIWENEEDTEYDYLFEGPDITQTEHVKVENVPGGLKFTITRPSEDCYNPNVLLREEFVKDEFGNQVYNYDYVDEGNGDYDWINPEYVGAGNGSYVMKEETDEYGPYTCSEYVGEGNGDYEGGWTYVGDGNGNYTREAVVNKIYGGWGYTAIYRSQKIDGKVYSTTCAVLPSFGNMDDTLECIYPLSTPGEKNVFFISMESVDSYNYYEYKKGEDISIVAEDGLGDIDCIAARKNAQVNLTYDGEKPVVSVNNYDIQFPEYVININSVYDVDIGNGDWDTEYATKWYISYNGHNGIEFDIAKDPYLEQLKGTFCIFKDENGNETTVPLTEEQISERYRSYNFKNQIELCDKDEFCVYFYLTFQLAEEINCEGITGWRTADVMSNIVKFR